MFLDKIVSSDKIPEWLKNAALILACQIGAPLDALNLPPLFGKLKVVKVTHHEAVDISEVSFGMGGGTYKYDPPMHHPNRTEIRFEHNFWSTVGLNDCISIDHETNTVILLGHHGLLYKANGGSGVIGLYVIGIPGLILFAPLLILNYYLSYMIEEYFGMDKYALNFYLRVKDDLNPEVREQLKSAFKNNYARMKIRMKEWKKEYSSKNFEKEYLDSELDLDEE